MLRELAKKMIPAQAQSFFRTRYYDNTTKAYHRRIVEHAYGQSKLKVLLADPVSEAWYDKSWQEPSEITLLRHHRLKPGALVFDLGAHQGIVALVLGDIAGPTGKIVALEANPHNAAVAEENVRMNRHNVTVLNCAAAAADGTIVFNRSFNGQVDGGSGTHGTVEVTSRSVDSLADEFGHPDVVFIDIEGFECEALAGARSVLARGSDVFVEVHGGVGLEKFGGSNDKVLSFFPAATYDLYFAKQEQEPFIPLNRRELEAGKRWFLVAIHRAAASN